MYFALASPMIYRAFFLSKLPYFNQQERRRQKSGQNQRYFLFRANTSPCQDRQGYGILSLRPGWCRQLGFAASLGASDTRRGIFLQIYSCFNAFNM